MPEVTILLLGIPFMHIHISKTLKQGCELFTVDKHKICSLQNLYIFHSKSLLYLQQDIKQKSLSFLHQCLFDRKIYNRLRWWCLCWIMHNHRQCINVIMHDYSRFLSVIIYVHIELCLHLMSWTWYSYTLKQGCEIFTVDEHLIKRLLRFIHILSLL